MALSTGLMAFWADFDEPDIPALREWHNCQHMSERVNIQGFRLGRRYRGFDRAATFLMYYETETPEVLAGPHYRHALENPTDWTRRALTLFRNPARAIFGLVEEAGVQPAEPAFYLATLRFNLVGDDAAVLSEYRGGVLPQLAARRGVTRVRLWENRRHITNLGSEESRIYGSGPGRQRFALFVECSERPELPEPSSLPGLDGASRAAHDDVIPEVGWLDFALR